MQSKGILAVKFHGQLIKELNKYKYSSGKMHKIFFRVRMGEINTALATKNQ